MAGAGRRSTPWVILLSLLVLVAGLVAVVPAAPPARAAGTGPELVSFTPFRAADTRIGTGVAAGLVAAGQVLEVPVAGRLGVPADAGAVSLNVTVTQPSAAGHVTVYPCGQALPLASNLNYSAGQTIPNAVIARIGAGGKVCLRTHAATHLVVDVNSYFPAGSVYTPMTPVRAADTRSGIGVLKGLVPAGQVLEVPVAGKYGVPGGAEAAVLNVTVTQPEAAGHITVYPCGQGLPLASSLNYSAGQTVPNMVIARIGAGGKVCLRTHAATHLVVDINGHFPAGSEYTPLTPVRAADTRKGDGVPAGLVPAGRVLEVPVAGRLGVPADAAAAVLNVTVTQPGAAGHITVFPCGQGLPVASNLNYGAGQTVPNAVIARIGAGGKVCLHTHAPTHLVVDINGYYTTPDVGAGATAVAVQGSAEAGPFHADGHACSLMPGGYVKCWGANGAGQVGDGTTVDRPVPVQVLGISGATAIDAGRAENCAIISDGTVKCWGRAFGPSPVAVPGFAGATAISVTGGPCAVVGGTVKCLSNGSVLTKPGLSGVRSLATMGPEHGAGIYEGTACAIVSGGAVACWRGEPFSDSGLAGGTAPVFRSGVSGATSVAVNSRNQCAVVPSSGVLCWGSGPAAPQAGTTGATSVVNTYSEWGDGKGVVTEYGGCALVAGVVKCWGSAHAPSATISGATSLGHSGAHGCAVVAGGSVTCWGRNSHGELGNGTTSVVPDPVAVPGLSGATTVVTESSKSCAILSGGAVSCWGGGGFAPAPQGTKGATALALVPDSPREPWGAHACAIVAGGAVPCMGPSITGATTIASGGVPAWDWMEATSHVCAIVGGGAVKCSDSAGGIGPSAPVSVVGITNAVAIEATGDTSCALLATGIVQCWGHHGDGYVPTVVPGIAGATGFDAASGCAIVAGGAVNCWSADGTIVPVAGITGATKIDGNCVIVAGGAVQCFTRDGGASSPIAGITGATSLGARGHATCAVTGGAVKCWGHNTYGSVGVNTRGPVQASV